MKVLTQEERKFLEEFLSVKEQEYTFQKLCEGDGCDYQRIMHHYDSQNGQGWEIREYPVLNNGYDGDGYDVDTVYTIVDAVDMFLDNANEEDLEYIKQLKAK